MKHRKISEEATQFVFEMLMQGKIRGDARAFAKFVTRDERDAYHAKMEGYTGDDGYELEVSEAIKRFNELPLNQALTEENETV
jgi:hypothetical protein